MTTALTMYGPRGYSEIYYDDFEKWNNVDRRETSKGAFGLLITTALLIKILLLIIILNKFRNKKYRKVFQKN